MRNTFRCGMPIIPMILSHNLKFGFLTLSFVAGFFSVNDLSVEGENMAENRDIKFPVRNYIISSKGLHRFQ